MTNRFVWANGEHFEVDTNLANEPNQIALRRPHREIVVVPRRQHRSAQVRFSVPIQGRSPSGLTLGQRGGVLHSSAGYRNVNCPVAPALTIRSGSSKLMSCVAVGSTNCAESEAKSQTRRLSATRASPQPQTDHMVLKQPVVELRVRGPKSRRRVLRSTQPSPQTFDHS